MYEADPVWQGAVTRATTRNGPSSVRPPHGNEAPAPRSIIDWHGGNGVAFGSQGPDISAIPSIALRQVEVLRDGAAAQYGSDAIAGVMNFQLKDAPSGGAVELNTGTFGAGDGEAFNVAANAGLPLGSTGFANLSVEYGGSNPTDRSAPRSDAIALLAAGNTDVASDTPQVWGSPRVEDDLKLFGNFGYTAANGVQLYGHTNYASKTVTGGFFFRNPNTRGGVYSIDGGQTLEGAWRAGQGRVRRVAARRPSVLIGHGSAGRGSCPRPAPVRPPPARSGPPRAPRRGRGPGIIKT